MALTTKQMQMIAVDTLQGVKQRVTGPEAEEFRRKFKQEADEAAKQGYIVEIPPEIEVEGAEELEAGRSTNPFFQPATQNVFCPTGPGGGIDPTCSPGGSKGVEFPELDNTTFVKMLGGSTGAKLVQDQNGKLWVAKKGKSEGQLRAEQAASDVYAAAGIRVQAAKIYETENGPIRLAEYLEGKTLDQYSPEEQKQFYPDIRKGFAVDAALANWDVVGMTNDNILITEDGKAVRIDVGGSLDYRAQGASKGDKWNENADEFESLRDPWVNGKSAAVFKGMTPKELEDSVNLLDENKTKIIAALPDKYRDVVEQRIEKIVDKAAAEIKPTIKASSFKADMDAAAKSGSSAVVATAHAEALVTKITDNPVNGKVKFNAAQLEKIKLLNPEGVKDNTVYIPFASGKSPNAPGNVANKQYMENLLPGTNVKFVYVTSKSLEHADKLVNANGKLKTTTGEDVSKYIKVGKTGTKDVEGMGSYKTATEVAAESKQPYTKEGMVYHPDVHADFSKAVARIEKQMTGDGTTVKRYVETSPTPKAHLTSAALTSKEQDVLGNWKGSAQAFRQKISSGEPDAKAKALLSALDKAPTYQGLVNRGVSNKGGGQDTTTKNYANHLWETFTKQVGVGGHWTEDAPHCTSRNIETATYFAGNDMMMHILTRTGAVVEKVGGFSSEQEVTGKANTTYRVLKLEQNKYYTGAKHNAGTAPVHYEKPIKYVVWLEEVALTPYQTKAEKEQAAK